MLDSPLLNQRTSSSLTLPHPHINPRQPSMPVRNQETSQESQMHSTMAIRPPQSRKPRHEDQGARDMDLHSQFTYIVVIIESVTECALQVAGDIHTKPAGKYPPTPRQHTLLFFIVSMWSIEGKTRIYYHRRRA